MLYGREAMTLNDAEQMRIVRNTCRAAMTRSTDEITPEQQITWWATLDRAKMQPFVFVVLVPEVDDGSLCSEQVVGYGLVREEDGRSWVTGGLLPEWRGQGLGTELFHFLMQHVRMAPCWLEVREDNLAAQRIYTGLGFIESSKRDGIITMVEKHLL